MGSNSDVRVVLYNFKSDDIKKKLLSKMSNIFTLGLELKAITKRDIPKLLASAPEGTKRYTQHIGHHLVSHKLRTYENLSAQI